MPFFYKKSNKKQVTHSNNKPRSGQYLTHGHCHITWAVAAEAAQSFWGGRLPRQRLHCPRGREVTGAKLALPLREGGFRGEACTSPKGGRLPGRRLRCSRAMIYHFKTSKFVRCVS